MQARDTEPSAPRRRLLWSALSLLVFTLLALLVWLANRFEVSQVQDRLERDASEAVVDIRAALTRNLQSLQKLQFHTPGSQPWRMETADLLRQRRELVRIEWRDSAKQVLAFLDSPYRAPVFNFLGRTGSGSDVGQTCEVARRLSGPAYSSSYFVLQSDVLGLELMDLCWPIMVAGRESGFLVVSYSLQDMLSEFVGSQYAHGREVSFTEGDGTRLAIDGAVRRVGREFSAKSLLELPGNTLVLRLNSWRRAPELFPNVLSALVAALALALTLILWLLGRDMRRRLRAERELADTLAFRKAMEDSLLTGLRARDLQGRITYVNPAFCQMVGFPAEELVGQSVDAPYWPPEYSEEYKKRQAIRLAGKVPPREGFESVFMRKDGTRFPVLIIEAPLINAQGAQTGWMSAFLDISEQRKVEELSRASQERLQATARLALVGEMASLLSHELNQPLAAIAGYAAGMRNLQQTSLLSDADAQLVVQRISEQAERAGRIIKSVHDFVRRRDQAREDASAQELIDAILPLLNLQARKLSVQVSLLLRPDLPRVHCDRTMVEQVLLNLARNGMQAMDEPGLWPRLLELRAQVINVEGVQWVEFSVADIGTGIAPEIEQQLFTPFFTTKAEGMGLGLSLCRTVIEQHGGTMRFERNQPRGTVFSFTLPCAESA